MTITVNAQQTGLSLSPSLTEIMAKPGTSSDISFTLENVGDPALVSLKILPFNQSDNFGNIQLKPVLYSPIEFNIKNYALSEKKPFIMKSHEKRKVELSFSIPENTVEADYYFSLVAQTDPPPGTEGSVTARASIAVASNILFTVASEYPAIPEAKIAQFEILSSKILNIFGKKFLIINSGIPADIVLTVQNNSLHRIKPEGSITLEKKSAVIQSFLIPPQNILAQSQRTVESTIPYRNGKSTITIQSLSPGIYKMNARISQSGSTVTLQDSIGFIALPFRLMLLSFTISAVLAVLVYLKLKKRNSDFHTA